MDKDRIAFLKNKANQIRGDVISVSVSNKAGHIAPSLSTIDLLVALYYEVMNYNQSDPSWEDRDRLVFSKSHGCYGLYSILADKGIIPKGEWQNFYTPESTLLGCMERRVTYGIEAGCGSLGHGLPIAVGIAFGAKVQGKKYLTFCVVGDGELQEGSNWEALQFAVKHKVNNLVVIIDRNRLQAMDFIVNILDRDCKDLINKLSGFGTDPVICPGHDMDKLVHCLKRSWDNSKEAPYVVVAETVKGFGLKCMENIPKFHFRIPSDQEISLGNNYE